MTKLRLRLANWILDQGWFDLGTRVRWALRVAPGNKAFRYVRGRQ